MLSADVQYGVMFVTSANHDHCVCLRVRLHYTSAGEYERQQRFEQLFLPAFGVRSSGLGTECVCFDIGSPGRNLISLHVSTRAHISCRTFHGQPVRICRNASLTAPGTSRCMRACHRHLVTERTISDAVSTDFVNLPPESLPNRLRRYLAGL